jgi:hypothetical protein
MNYLELLLHGFNTLSVLHQRLRSEIVDESQFAFMDVVLWRVTSPILVVISEDPATPIIRASDCPNTLTAVGFPETSVPQFMASHVVFSAEKASNHALWLLAVGAANIRTHCMAFGVR